MRLLLVAKEPANLKTGSTNNVKQNANNLLKLLAFLSIKLVFSNSFNRLGSHIKLKKLGIKQRTSSTRYNYLPLLRVWLDLDLNPPFLVVLLLPPLCLRLS